MAKVAPDLRRFVELLPDLSRLDKRLGEVRAVLGGEEPQLGDDGKVVASEVSILRQDGTALRALVYRPSGTSSEAKLPALLHVHGGGYVAGSANRDDSEGRETAQQQQCVVLIPDYRIAPENPYPAPLDDVVLAWGWMHEKAPTLGIDTGRMAIRGNSAGGGLAYAASLKLRDDPELAPCFLLLLFPMLDDRTSPHPHNGVYVWTHDNNRFGWDSYLRNVDRDNPPPLAAPGRIEDVAGLPPTFLATGAIDLFAGENLDLGRRLIDAGIALEMHVYPGAYHGFSLVPCSAAEAYKQDSANALRRAFATNENGEAQ